MGPSIRVPRGIARVPGVAGVKHVDLERQLGAGEEVARSKVVPAAVVLLLKITPKPLEGR